MPLRIGQEVQALLRVRAVSARSPDTATEELRHLQLERCDLNVPAPTMNANALALRFVFMQTPDRSDLTRKLVPTRHLARDL